MKKIAYLFSAATLVALSTLTSCKKDKDTPVDNNPDAPVVTSTMTSTNMGNSGTAIASLDVTTSTGTAKIRLDVTSTTDVDYIYILKSEDNGTLQPLTVADVASQAGATFTGGSASYSLKVPGSTQAFIIDIPVTVRSTSAAVTDVYYVWLTNGSGAFTKPTKGVVLGPAVITLKYTAATTIPFATATVNVGTQSAVNSSFLVTSGQVSALSTTDYNDAPASADIRFVTLDGSGVKNNTATNVFMYSPSNVPTGTPSDASAPFSVALGSSTTYFATSTVTSSTFSSVTGDQLSAIPALSTNTSIQIVSGGVYEFYTQAGKKGLILVNSLTADTDATAAGGYNANVTVKVLN